MLSDVDPEARKAAMIQAEVDSKDFVPASLLGNSKAEPDEKSGELSGTGHLPQKRRET